jgi:hypothetical protein
MNILTSCFFIELDDDSLKIMEAEIDVNGLFLKKPFYSCGFDSFGT